MPEQDTQNTLTATPTSNPTDTDVPIKKTPIINYILIAIIIIGIIIVIYIAFKKFSNSGNSDIEDIEVGSKDGKRSKPTDIAPNYDLHESVNELETIQNTILNRLSNTADI